ncbi:MAG: hypothetical protein MPN21_17445 [Thermoanaerobaculia bacterium]|nr:hypothetical protein [Thermoanaerobaculia bacterium]
MVDLPQHAAQVGTWLRWSEGGFPYSDYLWINWRTPYLVANTLATGLSHLMPVASAFKVVISLALLGVPLATLALLREVGGNPLSAYLAIPAAYSFSFYLGFVAFTLATALSFFFLLLAWRQAERPSRRGAWLIFGFLQLLFFTHPLAFGWAGLIGALLTAARAPNLRSAVHRWIPYLAALTLPIAWLLLTVSRDTLVPAAQSHGLSRLLQIPAFTVGLPIHDLALVLGVVVLAAPFLGGGRFSPQRTRWIPVLTTLGLFLVTPQLLLGTNYIHQRFGAFLLPTLLFALDPREGVRTRRIRFFLLAPAALWTAFVLIQSLGYRAEVGAFDEILGHMEENRHVLYLPLDAQSEFLPFPVFLHFGSWYQAQSGGLVDFSFASYFPNRFRYHPERRPPLPSGFEFRPWTFRWREHDGPRYDYFLVRSQRDPSPLFRKDQAPVVLLATASGNWWLFARHGSGVLPTAMTEAPSSETSLP